MKKSIQSSVYVLGTLLLFGCNGGSSDPVAGARLGQDQVQGTPQPVPSEPPSGNNNDPANPADPASPSTAHIGESCADAQGSNICLSLRYVVYKDSSGKPVINETKTLENLAEINRLWAQCGIAFEIGEYVAADPTNYGLSFNTPTNAELTRIRQEFADPAMLSVITTGAWSGSLGAGAANAWTMMPGGGDYGVVLESTVGEFPNIIAHELGHYLNLGHVADVSDVMNAVIYSGSTKLTETQCSAARSAAAYYWKSMYR